MANKVPNISRETYRLISYDVVVSRTGAVIKSFGVGIDASEEFIRSLYEAAVKEAKRQLAVFDKVEVREVQIVTRRMYTPKKPDIWSVKPAGEFEIPVYDEFGRRMVA